MGFLGSSDADILPPEVIDRDKFDKKTALTVFFCWTFVNYYLTLKVKFSYLKNMNLSKIKNDLQQVLQLVEEWCDEGINELERDLVLAQLRDIYSQLRFGEVPKAETISESAEENCDTSRNETETVAIEETPASEMPIGVAISLDDVFEGFIPEDLMPIRPDTTLETVEPRSEEPSPTESESAVFEEPVPEANTSTEVGEEPAIEESVITEQEKNLEPAEDVIVEQELTPAEAEMPTAPEIEENNDIERDVDVVEEPAPMVNAEPSLFGDELFAPRVSRRARMMSLYNDEDVSVVSKSEKQSVPTISTPAPIKEEPASKVEPAYESPASEETVESIEPAAEHTDNQTEVAEVEIETATVSAQDDFALTTPAEEKLDETTVSAGVATPYVEPQIEVEIAHPAANAVPESEQVLGEVIKSDVRTIADTIKPKNTTAEKIAKGAVDDIGKAIGINDRFLLIRDLFGGDSEAYERTIAQLNAFDNLEDCMIYITENFDWNPNTDGAKMMVELIERKYN